MKSIRDIAEAAGDYERGEAGSNQHSPSQGRSIDVEALAERVYRLLLEDMRLARSRSAIGRRPREW